MEKIPELVKRFYLFIGSSFSAREKQRLFEFIWKNYHKKIGFYISNLIPFDHPAFEDVFQDIFIKIYRNLHTFNPMHSFKAWIYRISRNHCLDFLKNRSRTLVQSNEIQIEKIQDNRTPETILENRELHDHIEQAILSLDPLDREISYLRFYENLTYRAIGRILDMNVNTVKSRARSIKEKLKKNLEN